MSQPLPTSSTIPPRNRPPTSPSPRQPHKSRHFNEADLIESQLQTDNHKTWGYVIYRTTYSSDSDWDEFLRRLRFRMERDFDDCNGRDILDLFTLTVFDDRGVFDHADTPAVRAHFRQWAENAFRDEQRRDSSGDGGSGREEVRMGRSPRYQFCVVVDEAALHSVVHNAPAPPKPDATKKGWVKLVSKAWVPIEEDPRARGHPDPNLYEPIEGITERDVGWMKVPYGSVMTEYYSGNEGLNGWRTEYCRPPKVVGPPYDE